jgi:hypothetical protein
VMRIIAAAATSHSRTARARNSGTERLSCMRRPAVQETARTI